MAIGYCADCRIAIVFLLSNSIAFCRVQDLAEPSQLPPESSLRSLTYTALHALAASATQLTHAARDAACRRVCAFLVALPADVQSFTEAEALSLLGALSCAVQDTGAACVADVLAAVLEQSPVAEAAAAAAAPLRNRVHSAASVAQIILRLQVRTSGSLALSARSAENTMPAQAQEWAPRDT